MHDFSDACSRARATRACRACACSRAHAVRWIEAASRPSRTCFAVHANRMRGSRRTCAGRRAITLCIAGFIFYTALPTLSRLKHASNSEFFFRYLYGASWLHASHRRSQGNSIRLACCSLVCRALQHKLPSSLCQVPLRYVSNFIRPTRDISAAGRAPPSMRPRHRRNSIVRAVRVCLCVRVRVRLQAGRAREGGGQAARQAQADARAARRRRDAEEEPE
eukprot:6183025-Pleurochrysis_carterae.AAC.2